KSSLMLSRRFLPVIFLTMSAHLLADVVVGDYVLRTVDYPGQGSTYLMGINASGQIAGVFPGFMMSAFLLISAASWVPPSSILERCKRDPWRLPILVR